MIKSIEFVRDLGDGTYAVKNIELGAPETSGLWIKSIKGIGPGKADINTTDFASSDGGVFNSARSQIRNITLTLGLLDYELNNTHYSVEDVRRDTYKIFGKKANVVIYIHTDRVDLYTYGYVESCEPDIFNKQETMSISIICPNPNFYSMTGHGGVDFSATESVFEFPENYVQTEDGEFLPGQFYYEYDSETQQYFFTLDQEWDNTKTYYKGGLSNEIDSDEYIETEDESFAPGKEYFEADPNNVGQYIMTSDSEMDENKTYYEYDNKIIFANILDISREDIYYVGEIEVGITISLRFNDEANGVVIYKYLTENDYESMELDDAAIQTITGGGLTTGDEIIINTVKGDKYAELIREGEHYNIMNALGRNPNWFQLDYGRNTFSYSANSGASFIDVSIDYEEAYEGV